MYFLFSGEGATDLGVCEMGDPFCEGSTFLPGPMTLIVKFLVEKKLDYGFIGTASCGLVPEFSLEKKAGELRLLKKPLTLTGKKRPKETIYFYRNARALGKWAKELSKEIEDDVVAILFRDSDGTASSGRGLWSDKKDSIIRGFETEDFARGVAMIPKPKSEAWLICALKTDPYLNCGPLEDRSGNDKSPKSLKAELECLLGEPISRETLSEMVSDGTIDAGRIDMPSFKAFHESLLDALNYSR